MKKFLNNIYLIILLYIVYAILLAVKWGRIDAQIIGIGIGSLISPFVIMLLIRTFKSVNKREFWGGIAVIGLIFSLADFLGLLGIINFVSVASLLFLLIRGAYLLITKSGKNE